VKLRVLLAADLTLLGAGACGNLETDDVSGTAIDVATRRQLGPNVPTT